MTSGQAFTFAKAAGFSSTEGEVRFSKNHANTFVQGDIDVDGVAGFEVRLDGLHTLSAGDFGL